MDTTRDEPALETAVLGGGCFWCLEAVYGELEGVEDVASGYAGGHADNPTYQQVCSGATGHAEVVRVRFDPSVLSYGDVLDVFFAIHDPTTPNRQGADVGTQYRSIILTTSPGQREEAERRIRELDQEGLFDAPIVTEVEPLERFFPAEDYHREYHARNPGQAYCRVVIDPKLGKFRRRFADRLKARAGS